MREYNAREEKTRERALERREQQKNCLMRKVLIVLQFQWDLLFSCLPWLSTGPLSAFLSANAEPIQSQSSSVAFASASGAAVMRVHLSLVGILWLKIRAKNNIGVHKDSRCDAHEDYESLVLSKMQTTTDIL